EACAEAKLDPSARAIRAGGHADRAGAGDDRDDTQSRRREADAAGRVVAIGEAQEESRETRLTTARLSASALNTAVAERVCERSDCFGGAARPRRGRG